MSSIVFPFIATCLATGTALNDENAHVSNVSLLPISSRYDGIENDDGITVLDITDAANTRYGFIIFNDIEIGPDSAPELVPGLTVLDAKTYIGLYYAEDELEHQGMLDTIAKFEAIPKITVAALKSVWPGSGWKSLFDATATTGDVTFAPAGLKEMALANVLDEALHGDPIDLTWLSHAEELSEFLPALYKRLCDDPDLLKLPSGSRLASHCYVVVLKTAM